jgi:hypothetical protein
MKTFSRCLITIATMVALGIVSRVQAQDNSTTTPPPPPPAGEDDLLAGPYYHAQEVSLDMFGSGTVHQDDHQDFDGRFHHHAQAGGGVGLNYFFSRYVGVGGDAYTEDRDPCFIYAASGNVIIRLPIDHTGIAPYVFGGGGHQWDFVSQNFGQAGAGVEIRLCRHLGFFVDGRWVIAERTENYGLGRAGLRISF